MLEEKTKKKRRLHLIAIQGDIVEYCIEKQPDDFLFPSKKTDSHISTTQTYRILVATSEWIGRRDIGTPTMRKTFGYHYYKRTKDVYTLMEIFGHASPTITKRYIEICED
ncbi:tyrosine-type recombinase/integrase [Rossellomorea marisflavi]|uniref:tyrosine-type recombinase/integrase n=1 Tax=Rossellomorea marisflavi TaxID=189381 RepID=UPI0025582A33|nr:tyrosine-type recombinase/integrase [Rossellomorea marisflavi]